MKKNIIILIIIIALILIGGFIFFTATHIEGIVYDAQTNKRVNDALVTINGIKFKTDVDGRFRAYSPPLNKVITVEKSGYKTFSEVFPAKFGIQIIEIGIKPYTFDEIFSDFKNKLGTIRSYHYTYEIQSEVNGVSEKMLIEFYQTIDASHFISKKENESYLEIYIFKDFIYYRDNETKKFEKIEKEKFQENLPILSLKDIFELFSIKSTPSSFTFLKESKLQNEEILIFNAKWEDLFSTSEGKIYLRKKDNIVIKMEFVDSGVNEEGKNVKTLVTFNLTDINKDIKISPPE